MTSRNWLERLSWRIARGWPDLIGSSEGGSNLILARPASGGISDRKEMVIQERHPERRTMGFVRLGSGACVANLHASTHPPRAEGELLNAAEQAVEWADGSPLVFGGDMNVRAQSSGVYDELERRFGLTGNTAPDSIDHLLVRDVESASEPYAWPPERRELPQPDGRALRLSDHAPVEREVTWTSGSGVT